MVVETNNLPTGQAGEQYSIQREKTPDKSTPSSTAPCNNADHGHFDLVRADRDPKRQPTRALHALLHHPYVIFGLTAFAMSVLILVMFALPSPDIAGRVMCVLGAAFSYFVGAEWYRSTRQSTNIEQQDLEAASLHDIDQKMEQLEDAKWQLSESAARYRDLLDQHQDMIIRLNGDEDLTFANRAFCQKFQIDYDNASRCPLAPDLAQAIRAASQQQDGARCELMQTSQGERWIEWEAHAVSGAGEAEIQYTGRDMTDAVIAQKELEAARDEAQIANRSKSRFLASMSHEIRTPMNGILGMVSLLQDDQLDKQQQTYVDAIELSARNLLSIIDEILDFTKLEAGKIKLSHGHFSIEDTVLSVAELLAPAAQEKGLELAWSVEPSACGEFFGDATRVRQVLLNLVSNAVKFTDAGGIRIDVTTAQPCRELKSDKTEIRLSVRDSGIGLSDVEQHRLFAEFEQTDQALKRQAGGTGLGLAISKRLARAMGGDLTVESSVGEGSCFTATLKLKPVFGAFLDPNYSWLHKPKDLKVLLACDRAIERSVLADTLLKAGISVVECNFDQALEQVQRAKDLSAPFTRIVIDADIELNVAKKLLERAQGAAIECGRNKADVRGVVTVGISSRDALTSFQDLGFDSYMVRPVRPKTVFERLIGAGTSEVNPGTKSQPELCPADPALDHVDAAAQLRSLKFLLVEDNDINAMLVEHQLQRAGHHVERMQDGKSALARMERTLSHDEESFDVILMDVLLPEMDGLEATAKIRQMFKDRNLEALRPPVIALTANAFEEDRKQCLAAGMDDYLAKPFDKAMLTEVLLRCLANRLSPAAACPCPELEA